MFEVPLSASKQGQIEQLVADKRSAIGGQELPIANNLLPYLENLGIHIVQAPVSQSNAGRTPSFSALYYCDSTGGTPHHYIGLNSADYFDRQLFALAHELYHFFTASQTSHFSPYILLDAREEGKELPGEQATADREANYFAAEFLLPSTTLHHLVQKQFDKENLFIEQDIPTLLRFIARIHLSWWLPYRSIVRRLYEKKLINEDQYNNLYKEDPRNGEGQYSLIAKAFDPDTYAKLNCMTKTKTIDNGSLECILSNYTTGLIDEQELTDTLLLFGKTPQELGINFSEGLDDTEDDE
ncbi:MAG: ImmA/IrrE family metallo-endopeptidase [Sphaerochaetaceae bacterium]